MCEPSTLVSDRLYRAVTYPSESHYGCIIIIKRLHGLRTHKHKRRPMTITTVATPGPAVTISTPLLLTAGDGPWMWSDVRYDLLDGAMDQTMLRFDEASIRALPRIGSLTRHKEASTSIFEFHTVGTPPVHVDMLATHSEAGVGAEIWASALALTIFMEFRWEHHQYANKPPARALELGAGLAIPGLALASLSGVETVTLTDSREPLLNLAKHNAELARQAAAAQGRSLADINIERFEWGGQQGNVTMQQVIDGFDFIYGSDIAYEEASVEPLVEILEQRRAPQVMLISPVGRPSFAELRRRLKASELVQVEERLLTLVCGDAAKERPEDIVNHSAGVHSLLVVTPTRPKEDTQ